MFDATNASIWILTRIFPYCPIIYLPFIIIAIQFLRERRRVRKRYRMNENVATHLKTSENNISVFILLLLAIADGDDNVTFCMYLCNGSF